MKISSSEVQVALFTGGIDKHYASGLGSSLASSGLALDVICDGELGSPEMRRCPNLRLVPLYEVARGRGSAMRKLLGILVVYTRLIFYATGSSAPIFHILWNYKFTLFDRTILLFYYKLLGKRVVFTAHNVNAAERDGVDSLLNRWSLRVQYRLLDHIFVHTEQMKSQLARVFGVSSRKVSVIPFGIYDMVPQSCLSCADARQKLNLAASDRTILFFGRITPYKGIDLLVNAFERLAGKDWNYRLLIAGEPMKEAEALWHQAAFAVEQSPMRERVIQHIRHIPDHEIEMYFKAADVLVLPYTQIFQSGVLFMAYSFGLPVIATDVGSFAQDIIPGSTGYVCRPRDPADLARTIEEYFSSELFNTLAERRPGIKNSIRMGHSWGIVADKTTDVYAELRSAPAKLAFWNA